MTMLTSIKAHLALLLLLSHDHCVDAQCTVPTGLDTLDTLRPGTLAQVEAMRANVPFLWLPYAFPFINEIIKPETPIRFRIGQIHGSTVYNAVARYHLTALDIWGRNMFRICQPTTAQEELDYKLHEVITAAYTFYYSGISIMDTVEDIIKPIFSEVVGLNPDLLMLDPPDQSTPWGIAKMVADDMTESLKADGWNADGKLTAKHNPLPFSDFSFVGANGASYEPYDIDTTPRTKDHWPWAPLMDSDGMGHFSKQQHVTPFIGFTGRLYGMNRSHYESFTSPPPQYDYEAETKVVLERTRKMASNDTQKALLEYFDSKYTSILPLQIDYSIGAKDSEFEFWYADMVLVNTMYDAVLLVWKEKVRHNAARPTTIVHELLGDKLVDTYAGPLMQAQFIPATEWQPFIRTMPHAEYPSGSACICTAYKETMVLLNEGEDDIGLENPLTHTVPGKMMLRCQVCLYLESHSR